MSELCKWLSQLDAGYGPYEQHFEYCYLTGEKCPDCDNCEHREPEVPKFEDFLDEDDYESE